MSQHTRLFVTVGTTSFDSLVEAVLEDDFVAAAAKFGFDSVVLQIGRGKSPSQLSALEEVHEAGSGDACTWTFVRRTRNGQTLPYTCYRFKANINEDIQGAWAVVSHAGAGSVFESLRAGRRLIVAINTALADNHQEELARALAQRGHLLYGEPHQVAGLLGEMASRQLEPLPPIDTQPFLRALEKVI